jgi:hypothetical protein
MKKRIEIILYMKKNEDDKKKENAILVENDGVVDGKEELVSFTAYHQGSSLPSHFDAMPNNFGGQLIKDTALLSSEKTSSENVIPTGTSSVGVVNTEVVGQNAIKADDDLDDGDSFLFLDSPKMKPPERISSLPAFESISASEISVKSNVTPETPVKINAAVAVAAVSAVPPLQIFVKKWSMMELIECHTFLPTTFPSPEPVDDVLPKRHVKISNKFKNDPEVEISHVFDSVINRIRTVEVKRINTKKGRNDFRSIALPFENPVNEKHAPGYYATVLMPMDFSTIHKKIARNQYITRQAFMNDVYLISYNSHLYNDFTASALFAEDANHIVAIAEFILFRERAKCEWLEHRIELQWSALGFSFFLKKIRFIRF